MASRRRLRFRLLRLLLLLLLLFLVVEVLEGVGGGVAGAVVVAAVEVGVGIVTTGGIGGVDDEVGAVITNFVLRSIPCGFLDHDMESKRKKKEEEFTCVEVKVGMTCQTRPN